MLPFAFLRTRRLVALSVLLVTACSKTPLAGLDGSASGGSSGGGSVDECGDSSSPDASLSGTTAGEAARQPPCEFCDPPSPVVRGDAVMLFRERATLAAADGDRAYVALPHGSLSVLDMREAARPRLLGQHRFLGRSMRLEVIGTRAVVVVDDTWRSPELAARLLVVETDDPLFPEVLADLALTGIPRGFFRKGSFLVVASVAEATSHLESIDLSNPTEPERVDSREIPHVQTLSDIFLPTFAFRGDHVYVATPSLNGETVGTTVDRVALDTSGAFEREARAELRGYVPGPDGIDETDAVVSIVTVEADTAFVEVLDRVSLEAIARHELSGLRAAVSGGRAYVLEGVAENRMRLDVMDLATPDSPTNQSVRISGLPYNVSLWPLEDHLLVGHFLDDGSETPALSQYDLASLELSARVEWPGVLSAPSLKVLENENLAVVGYREPAASPGGLCNPRGSTLRLVGIEPGKLTLGAAIPIAGDMHDVHEGSALSIAAGGTFRTVDASDPTEPVLGDEVRLASSVLLSAAVGSRIARAGGELFDPSSPYFDVVDVASAAWPAASRVTIGTIEGERACSHGASHLFGSDDDRVFALRSEELLDRDNETTRRVLAAFDVSGSEPPRELWVADFPVPERNEPNDSTIIGWTGKTIVSGTTINAPTSEALLDIVDVSDTAGPRLTSLELPRGAIYGAVVDSTLFLTRSEALEGNRVQHYLDRLDLEDPAEPAWLPSARLPGVAIAYDPSNERALVEEAEPETLENVTVADCVARFGWYARYESRTNPRAGTCSRHRRALSIVNVGATCPNVVARIELDEFYPIEAAASRRVYAALLTRGADSYPTGFLAVPWSSDPLEPRVVELGEGRASGLAVHESWVLVLGSGYVDVFDAERPDAGLRRVDLPGEEIHSVAFAHDNALVALGEDGLFVVPLTTN